MKIFGFIVLHHQGFEMIDDAKSHYFYFEYLSIFSRFEGVFIYRKKYSGGDLSARIFEYFIWFFSDSLMNLLISSENCAINHLILSSKIGMIFSETNLTGLRGPAVETRLRIDSATGTIDMCQTYLLLYNWTFGLAQGCRL